MKKFPKPWFRPQRGVWYVTLDGKQHNLGPDKDEAFQRYHELMSKPRERVLTDSVASICDSFLEWVQKHQAPDTYRWYKDRLQAILNAIPSLRVSQLRPYHIQQFVDGLDVSGGTKRNYIRSIKRAMKWAEEQGYIEKSPIAHMKKPKQGRRDNVISEAEHKKLLELTKDQNFRDLLQFAYLTGARCAEILAIEDRHLDFENHRVVFPVDEEKMERIPRIIYLNEEAEAILRRTNKEGLLFRNTRGNPWTPDATNCRFSRLAKKIGKKFCLTDYRHTFATRLLTAGVDALTVSILLGHSGISTLSRVYQHINHDNSYLLKAMRKAG